MPLRGCTATGWVLELRVSLHIMLLLLLHAPLLPHSMPPVRVMHCCIFHAAAVVCNTQVGDSILAMARPWQSHLIKFGVVEAFVKENIGMVLNLQVRAAAVAGDVCASRCNLY